jgi:threonine synthase
VDDTDHVMTRILDPHVRFPRDTDPNPFVRYRALMHSHHLWSASGGRDEDYRNLVGELDAEVARVDGRGFSVTPFARNAALSDRLGFAASGGVWVKDETGNVAGSHKARHLMGLLVHLEVVERLGLAPPGERPPLAIASCGNAALAAAVVAAAGRRPLTVFVPTDADTGIVTRLRDLGADVVACEREPGQAGDPAYLRLLRAIAEGALPFTCQGNLNGLAIEGGTTIASEIASSLAESGGAIDHLFVQVGGGALASACIQGLREAEALGVLPARPRTHTVQTSGAFPLERAHRLVADRAGAEPSPESIERALAHAATHRSEFMWPWEERPQSVATGILDDETYDWLAVVRGMLETQGQALVVGDDVILRAGELAREAAGIPVDPTGSAGLAGLMAMLERGAVAPDERALVLFTGASR